MLRWVPAALFGLTLLVSPVGASRTAAAQGGSPAATYYAAWFQDVEPLATEADRSAFLRLQTDEEREAFVRGFWRARDPTPGTPRNEAWEIWGSLTRNEVEGAGDSSGAPGNAKAPASPGASVPAEASQPTGTPEERLREAFDQALHRERFEAEPNPPPPASWLARDLAEVSAPPVPASLALAFPASYGGKTVLEGRLAIPRADLVERARTPVEQAALLVTGEVVDQGSFVDRFQYRFDLPLESSVGAEVPLRFYRQLAPGSYVVAIHLDDATGRCLWHEIRRARVPDVARRGLPDGVDPELLTVLFAESFPDAHSIEITPPGPGPHVGQTAVESVVTGPDVAEVRYRLDGRDAGSSDEPPYRAEIDLGRLPRHHTLQAEALDATGRSLAEDSLQVNAGPQRFAVRVVELARGKRAGGQVRVRAAVRVPGDSRLDRIEFFVDDRRAAVLYQPPFVQTLRVPPEEDVAYVRVVAHLADGRSTETVYFVRAPDQIDQLDVQLVELYTTVVDWRGRLVTGLGAGDFKVFDEGVEQPIQRFERVENLPIQVAVLIDTSDSMEGRLADARRSALRFFEEVLTPKDRAAVVTFNHQTHLAAGFTHDVKALEAATEGLVASGGTALYDSLIQSLYYFQGVQGERALILLSDGEDAHSRYTYQDALEYAKRSGVAIYPIAIQPGAQPGRLGGTVQQPSSQLVTGQYLVQLRELAADSGGRFFAIESVSELDNVYRTLEEELRSRYLLTYPVPKDPGKGFRRVEVQVAGAGRRARTMGGYYPR